MAYARFSTIQFPPDNAAEGESIMDELLRHNLTQPGCIGGMVLRSVTEPARYSRVTLWHAHQDADHAATTDHVVSLRSRLNVLAGDLEHRESSFDLLTDLSLIVKNL